jgi:hypothetical protein
MGTLPTQKTEAVFRKSLQSEEHSTEERFRNALV